MAWISSLTGDQKSDREKFEDFLHDGVVLCKLINRLAPGSVKKIGRKSEAAAMENINAFRAAAKVKESEKPWPLRSALQSELLLWCRKE